MNDQTYSPLCVQCLEFATISLATEVVEGPYGRQPACVRHSNDAGEAGAAMWSTDGGGAAEQIADGYRVMLEWRK